MTETLMPEGLGGRLVLAAGDYRRNRALWLKARRSGLGASDTATILGLNSWGTALEVWQEKTSLTPPDDRELSDAAAWGNILEHPVAVQTVKKWPEIGRIIPTPGLLAHPDHPWMLATVDRLLVPRRVKNPRVQSILEVKTTSSKNWGLNWPDGVPPAAIQVQVQQQLAVTGLPYAWVACWLRDTAKLCEPVRVDRSEEVIAQLIHYGGMWWRDHVEGMLRPEPTFGDRGQLAGLWPADAKADALTAGPELEATVADLIDAKRRKEKAEEDEEVAAFKLKTAMKERLGVVDAAGELLVTWKPQKYTRLDEKRLRAERPEIAKEFTPNKTIRVLRISKKQEQ
ncbi:RecE-like exonuclease [Arthrobacter phage Coral]|uniref:RecE-like exonuclease n=3 Tax=Coralvirus coral TaxID=2734227 RepID=A0A3G2KHL0_9CAUD|nr:RecE-like recombination exonuclease [Arthrobacter phage Coral]AYN57515.1 RecE-like exonuclease [Arthrobacter phage Coral]AYN57615.1 RecE-like exonuclease [Arthrobacter phage Cote]AYN58447.1 RecE-like exonuclease [Arthrobacter phage Lunar]